MVNETIKPGSNGLANIFRQQAIDALNPIDEHDEEFKVINTSAWLLLLVCLLILTSVVIWLVFGRITQTIESSGIVLATKQIDNAEAAVIQEMKEKKDKLDELEDLYNKKLTLYKKHYLTRIDMFRAKEEYVAASNDFINSKKTLLIPLQQHKSTSPILTLVFVNYLQAKKIMLGMSGYVMPTTSSHSRVSGRVIGITEYPVSKELIYHYLQNMELVDAYFNTGVPYLVKLQMNDNTLSAGTPVMTSITYKICTPLQLLAKSTKCD